MSAHASDSTPQPPIELTTTISLSSLRQVPNTVDTNGLLQTLPAEIVQILGGLDAHSAMLIALSGPSAGARFLLDSDSISLGRENSSDIFLDDITVSRKHSQISRSGDEFTIEDLKSLNGTYVNAQSIARTSLRTGDELHIGKYRLTFFHGQLQGGK